VDKILEMYGEELNIERVVNTHTNIPFKLKICVKSEELVETGGGKSEIEYIIGMLPLDVINDIKFSNKYNPRKLKPEQRDLLMEQIGTYGLINPLVAVMKKIEKSDNQYGVYLIDGRHRYNALLELDEKLKDAIMKLAINEETDSKSISASHKIRDPSNYAKHVIVNYSPLREGNSEDSAPMVPVKIYLNVEDVETIGMAVFINRGQKKLSGGEQIEKVARAFELAIEKQKEKVVKESEINEEEAAASVNKSNTRGVISSWIVDNVLTGDDSPWADIVGRWQGEAIDGKIKPLTANNFLSLVDTLVDTTPSKKYEIKKRDLEVQNLLRLGTIFSDIYNWPDDIPDRDNRYTPTSILTRSFLIRAFGIALNFHFMESDENKVFSKILNDEDWEKIASLIKKTHDEFLKQSELRKNFERLKKELDSLDFGNSKRPQLLKDLDDTRGKLWTLDTVTVTLKSRLSNLFKE
jgi:hypothetical protein